MTKQRVVIAGGGFGGVKTALALLEDTHFDVVLITDHADFRYYPTLYRTATGGRKMMSSIPLTEIFADKKIEVILDSIKSIDRNKKTIKTTKNKNISFDSLVLALGVQTNYFGIGGLKDLSYGIKTTYEAEELKQHLHSQIIDEGRPDLNYVVIGGGPTGIELAGALPAYLRFVMKNHDLPRRKVHVDLIEAAPRLVPRMPKDFSRHIARHLRRLGVQLYLNTTVEAQTSDALMVHDKAIRSHTVVWTAGVANNPFFSTQGFQLSANGKVRVDQFLQAEKDIFVIGDNADTPYSGLAQTALFDGGYIATNLKMVANSKSPIPYIAKRPIYVLPAGHKWAAVLWGRLRIYGRKAWWLRSLADLIAYHDYEPWQLATKRWLAEDQNENHCPICDR